MGVGVSARAQCCNTRLTIALFRRSGQPPGTERTALAKLGSGRSGAVRSFTESTLWRYHAVGAGVPLARRLHVSMRSPWLPVFRGQSLPFRVEGLARRKSRRCSDGSIEVVTHLFEIHHGNFSGCSATRRDLAWQLGQARTKPCAEGHEGQPPVRPSSPQINLFHFDFVRTLVHSRDGEDSERGVLGYDLLARTKLDPHPGGVGHPARVDVPGQTDNGKYESSNRDSCGRTHFKGIVAV